jgi:hypothetical protein
VEDGLAGDGLTGAQGLGLDEQGVEALGEEGSEGPEAGDAAAEDEAVRGEHDRQG